MNTPYPIAFMFHAMAASGNLSGLARTLQEVGPDHAKNMINSRDHRGFTVLHKAIESGNMEVIRLLIEQGADINAEVAGPDPEGWTALHLAAFDGHHEVVKYLLDHGADLSRPGKGASKMTPIRVAVTRAHPESVRVLLALGADPMEKDLQGFTLLHEAANIGDCEIAKLLVSAGCDPLAKASDGSTPLMWAAKHHDPKLKRLLAQDA